MVDFEAGLARARRMETNQHKMGRMTDATTPKTKLKGDMNPTSGGGINRRTQPKMKGR